MVTNGTIRALRVAARYCQGAEGDIFQHVLSGVLDRVLSDSAAST
jgi:hypothetical protein